jgi:hypothetical protein
MLYEAGYHGAGFNRFVVGAIGADVFIAKLDGGSTCADTKDDGPVSGLKLKVE